MDQGIVIGVRKHGETSVILDLLTRDHGRHLGYVRGGRSRRLRPCLQPGNAVHAVWRSRIEEQMGAYAVEPAALRAAGLLENPAALHAVNHLCALARLLPEREPHEALHAGLETLLAGLGEGTASAAAIVRFELAVLTDLGFGLDLARCAATGSRDDLAFVSPRTGRAVSVAAAAPYKDRLLPLPAFVAAGGPTPVPSNAAVLDGFRLTGHFLQRDLFGPRAIAMPASRTLYIQGIAAGQTPER